MSDQQEVWYAVADETGTVVSWGTDIDADALTKKGYTWQEVAVGKGEVAQLVDGVLSAVDLPGPELVEAKTLEPTQLDRIEALLIKLVGR